MTERRFWAAVAAYLGFLFTVFTGIVWLIFNFSFGQPWDAIVLIAIAVFMLTGLGGILVYFTSPRYERQTPPVPTGSQDDLLRRAINLFEEPIDERGAIADQDTGEIEVPDPDDRDP
jgi:hypothetical protein